MGPFRVSKKSKLYLAFCLLILVQYCVLCREQDPTNENVSVKSSNEKDAQSKSDDTKDSLVSKKDSSEQNKQDNLSPSDIIENVTDKVNSNSESDKDKVTSPANETMTKEDKLSDQPDSANDGQISNEENNNEDAELGQEDLTATGQDYHAVLWKVQRMAEKNPSLSEFASRLANREVDDIDNTVRLLEEASDFGFNIAKLALAELYFYGDLVNLNLNKAFYLFSDLASQGYAHANLVCLFYILYIGASC